MDGIYIPEQFIVKSYLCYNKIKQEHRNQSENSPHWLLPKEDARPDFCYFYYYFWYSNLLFATCWAGV